MVDTTLDISNLNIEWSQITPDDKVQSYSDEPTMLLRWRDGILEQMHWRKGYNAYGRQITRTEEWKAVPTASSA